MPVWIRRTLIAIAALLLVVVAGGAWLVSTFDANRYKSVAIDWMKTHRNRTLAIDGPVELSLFPRLQVKLSKIGLSEAGSATAFAAIDSAALAVDVLPLLHGELHIGSVEARGVSATLLRDAKGKRNIDDLLQPEPGPVAETPAANPGEPGAPRKLNFDVSSITLTDVKAHVKDDVAGMAGEMQLKELSTGRLANRVESPIQLSASFDFAKPALKGELSGSTQATPDLDTGSLALADIDLHYLGSAPGATGIDATVKGQLAWDGAKAALAASKLGVQISATAGGVKLSGSTLAIDRFSFDPSRRAFTVAKLQLRVKGALVGASGDRPLSLDFDWPALEVNGNDLKGSAMDGHFTLGGEAPLSASFKSGTPSGSFDAVRVPALAAQFGSDAAGRKVDLTLTSDLTLQPARRSFALDGLGLSGSIQQAGLAPLALAANGKASASPQAAAWALAGQINKQPFNTDGSVALGGARPAIKAQARFDALDLNALLAADKHAAKPAPPTSNAAANTAATPVDLSPLRSADANVDIRIGQFAYRQYRATDARLAAVLDTGVLRVNTLQAKVWGGSVDGTASADTHANHVSVNAVATGVNVNALLKDLAARDVLEGTGRVALDVDSTGRTVGEIKSHLRGTASLQLRDGAVKGVNLAKSFRQAKAMFTQKQDATQAGDTTEKTDFSELTASFRIDAGVARNQDLALKSPFFRIGGDGAIDLGQSRIDYTARATLTDTPQGQDGAELAALKGLTVPVHLTGPLDAVSWKIQWSGVAAGALLNTLKNTLQDKINQQLGIGPAASGAAGSASAPSPKDALKNVLKGLFK